AHYQGDPNFGASTSPPVTETISKAATTATLASSPTSAVAGEAVTFTATVSGAAPGTGTATGRVTFLNGTTALGTATRNTAGKATVTTATLSVGPHTITAVFRDAVRSEEHTSELQSLAYLVCRLLLE